MVMPDNQQNPSIVQPGDVQSSGEMNSVLDILLVDNQLTKEQYDEIQVKSASTGKSATEVLKESKFVTDEDREINTGASRKNVGIPPKGWYRYAI